METRNIVTIEDGDEIAALTEFEEQRTDQGGFGVEKQISVIFAMIGGFELSPDASLDEIEETSIRKSKLDMKLNEVVIKYGGVVDKIIQGFFMATFGTKAEHKNDPIHAVLAAMEIVSAVKETEGADIHIGVNSGPAWVGGIGTGEFTDQTVMGDTVNLSARLKTCAEHNGIVVSPRHYEATKDHFDYEELPAVTLKGITDPVPIFAIRGKKSSAEQIELLKSQEITSQQSLVDTIPPHLREKFNAAASTIKGERKIVTILRSDLSGFTALSERFKSEPAKIAELMDKVHHELGAIVYKYEGVVDQLVGDALVAIFGAPIVHEDDPERAVQAGLECLDKIIEFSDRMGKEMGMPPLNVHIGINTGRISIGDVSSDGSGKMDYTVIGEPVELAEVLEDISDDGEMLIGDRTYRLVRALFHCEKRADVEVGGMPQSVYKVLGKKENPELKRGVEALNKGFFVRHSELDMLKMAAENFIDTQNGYMIVMIGQAGLGKSRLKRELRDYLNERVTWIGGDCNSQMESTAYSLFISAFRNYFDIRDGDSEDLILEKLEYKIQTLFRNAEVDLSDEIIPYIGSQILSIRFDDERADQIRFLDPEILKQRTFAAIKDLLIAESKRRSIVLAFDDLHWIDDISLELSFYLMENVLDDRIFILNLYRPERTDNCWKIGEEARIRIPDFLTTIELLPFNDEESHIFLDSLLTLEGADDLKSEILQRAVGNPFYMEEVLRDLIDDEIIVKVNPDDASDSRWHVIGEASEIRMSDSLEQMMGARIDRMTDAEKIVLQNGSVAGRVFNSEVVADVSETANRVEEIDDRYQILTSLDMLDLQMPLTDPPEYAFGHMIVHDIAYNAIPAARRRNLHTLVADEVEDRNQSNLERVYETLAQHYQNGDNSGKAIVYLTKAGSKAQTQYNNSAALNFYQNALDRLENVGDDQFAEERLIALEGCGDVLNVLGELDDAIDRYDSTLELVGDPVSKARLKRKKAVVYERKAEYDRGIELLDSALEDLKAESNSVEEATVYNVYGSIQSKKGNFSDAIENAIEALDLAIIDLTAPDLIAAVEKNLGIYYLRTRDVENGRKFFNRAIDRASKIGDKVLTSQLYNNLGIAAQMSGQIDVAVENLQTSLEIKEELGDAVGLVTAYGNLGLMHSTKGEPSEALDCYEHAMNIARRTGAMGRVAEMEGRIGTVHWKQNDFDTAIEHYQNAFQIREEIGDRVGTNESIQNLAEAHLGKGNLESAESYARQAIETAGEIGVPQSIAAGYIALASIQKAKGDLDNALDNFTKAAEIAEDSGAKVQLAEANHYGGEVQLELENYQAARDLLQKAKDLWTELKNVSKVSAVDVSLAKCL